MVMETIPKPIEIAIDLKMFDKQKEFHHKVRETRWVGFFGGADSGKTTAGAMEAVYQVVKHPGPPLLIVAPTFPMLRRVTKRKFLQILPRELIKSSNDSQNFMELYNGTPIDFCSTQHPDSLYGSSVGRIWLDEAPLMPQKAFDILKGRLREGPEEHQRGWVDGTPKGMNWAYDEFRTDKPNRDCIYDVCSADNPFAGVGVLSDLRTLTGLFREQEYEGRFVKFEGLVYPMIEDHTHQIERPVIEMVRFIAGEDHGYEHPWVFVVAGQDEAGRYHCFEEIYLSHQTTDARIELVQDLMNRYPLNPVYSPDDRPEVIQAYRDAGIPVVAYKRDVDQGIPVVAATLAVVDGKAGLTYSAAVPKVYSECKQYQWRKRPDGSPGKEEPLKVADHGPDAVRSFVHGEKQQGGTQEIILLGEWGDED